MNEPRRLSQSGGVSQRLLDSASIDKPSAAARRRAALLAGTASSFSTSSSRSAPAAVRPASVAKTLAVWMVVGAAASATLALLGSKLLDSSHETGAAAAPTLAELPPAPSPAPARSPDIAAEPQVAVKEPSIAATPPGPSGASADEAREIEVARAAIKRGDNLGALATLDAYDKAHPGGALKADALALRIQALKSGGRAAEARALSNEFQSRYPQHPLVNQAKTVAP
jgi:hypothetical protein